MCLSNCNALGSCVGEMTYTVERLAACAAAIAIVSCIMFTTLFMLGTGIGLGYNYCFVETRLNATLKAAKSQKIAPLKLPLVAQRRRRSNDLFPIPFEKPLYLDKHKVFNRPEEENLETVQISKKYWNVKQMESSTDSDIEIKPTIVVPLRHFGLIILIKKLQNKSRNFTLELITENS